MTGPAYRPRTIPALDAMRLIGVLAVMATHAGFYAGIYTNRGVFGHLAARMDVGVAVFFVLSGFLLSREWLVPAAHGRPRPAWTLYLWKRLLRIYPAYLVAALIALTLVRANHGLPLGDWIITLTMVGIYTTHALPHGFTQTWSLGTEVAFYVLLPVIMRLAVGRRLHPRRIVVMFWVLTAFGLWWLADLAGRLPLDGRPANQWLPAYLLWFAAGITLAAVHTAPELFPRLSRVARAAAESPGACWVAVLGILLVAASPVAGQYDLLPSTTTAAVTKSVLYGAVGVLLIVPAAFGGAGGYRQVLAAPALRHLGHISYSMFLLHMAVIELVMRLTGYPLFGGHFLQIYVLTLALTIVAAELLYRLVERPFMRLRPRERSGTSEPTTTPRATTSV